MNLFLRSLATFCAFVCTELYAASNLNVTLTPAQAVSGGAQWNVDGGAWRNSGTTVTGLSTGSHTVSYKAIAGWIAPASTTVTLKNGGNSLTATYVQTATLKVTLSPSSGQWRVDGGSWQASSTTVSGLTPGNHTVNYAAVSGYTSPASETVSLTAGQAATLTRSYVQLAQLNVTLTPASGQWRVDGGAWQSSGSTLANLISGAHIIDYSSLTGYSAPASESITLAVGQSLTLARSYTQLAQISISLVPASGQWRANGGAWQTSGASLFVLPGNYTVEYSALSLYDSPPNDVIALSAGGVFATTRYYVSQKPTLAVALTPNTGQWRIDGSAWQNSGATVTELNVGSHTLDYLDIGGNYAPLSSETISLNLRDHTTLSRAYSLKPASLSITLTPNTAQWRVSGGTWLPSGAVVSGLTAGSYIIEYSAIYGYVSPSNNTVTLAIGELRTLTASYTPLASVHVTTTPSTTLWRIDNGNWYMSGSTTVNNLAFDVPHTVEFNSLDGYVAPPPQTFTLAAGELREVMATYQKLASVHVTTTPSETLWRIDNGNWYMSGSTTVNNLAFDVPHTVEFNSLDGYVAPPPQTFTLAAGELREVVATYQKLASVHVTTTPSETLWRIDNGNWYMSGSTTVNNLAFDVPHTVEFNSLDGYVAPPPQTFTLAAGELREVMATYQKLASVHVTTTPSETQWRIDNGPWYMSGSTTVNNLAFDVPHTVEFNSVAGYVAPPPQTFTLAAGELREVTATFQKLASVYVSTTPSTTQWRIDNGSWYMSGSTIVNNLAFGIPHTVDFKDLDGYTTPASQTFTLAVAEFRELTATYLQLASLGVTLDPATAQWRLDGGSWNVSGSILNNLSVGAHTIEYSPLDGFVAPLAESVNLVSGSNPTLARSYTPAVVLGYRVTALPTPSGKGAAGYSINDAGMVAGLTNQFHYLAFRYSNDVLQELGTLGGTDSTAYGINLNGTVVGESYTTGNAAWHAFSDSNGVMQDLGTLGGNSSHAFGINDAGAIVGYSNATISGPPRAFLFSNGVMQDLGTLGGTYSEAYAINNAGTVVGKAATVGNATWHAFRYSNGVMQDLGTLGVNLSQAVAINDLGVVAGDFHTTVGSSATHAFIYDSGGMRDLGTLGGSTSRAYDINNSGKVVGYSFTSTGQSAFIYENGAMKDLNNYINIQDLQLPWAYGINNQGQIIASNGINGYLLTPDSTLGSIQIGLTSSIGQWRIDGGPWRLSGSTLFSLSPGTHTLEYADTPGYITPPSETINLISGSSQTLFRTYAAEPFTIVKSFEDFGDSPVMLLGQDGLIYGAMISGGSRGAGHVFKMNRDGTGLQILKSFNVEPDDGLSPNALIEGADGSLYGTTANGGIGTDNGTLFRVNKDGSGYICLHSFVSIEEGFSPNSLLEGSDGALYGTTVLGGAASNGVIFRVNRDGSDYTVLKSMNLDEGHSQLGLTEGPSGMLYGMAAGGGYNPNGTIFRISMNGSGYRLLKIFGGGSDGSNPGAKLILGSDGLLYGTTHFGGIANMGLVFRLSPNGSGYQVLHHFVGGNADGQYPVTDLTEDANGLLCGSTLYGGAFNKGVLFRMNKDGSNFNLLLSLSGGTNDGGSPASRTLVATDGTLYCSTGTAGIGGAGVIFSINQDGSGFSALKQMGALEGKNPMAPVLVASDGAIYGTTYNGGNSSRGTVFKIHADGTEFSVLHQFAVTDDGAWPLGSLLEGSDGVIYGTTYSNTTTSGLLSRGSIFRINKDGTSYALLHQFSPFGGDGRYPHGLSEASNGLLYGTTQLGGTAERGMIFRMSKDGSGYTILRSFSTSAGEGQYPYAPVVEAANGQLYGTTWGGGSGYGTIFALNKDGTAYTVLRRFVGGTTDGAAPLASIVQGSDGALYGTTNEGGVGGVGTLFRLNLDGTGYQVIKNFLGGTSDGASPLYAGVVEKNGVLYGTTQSGGTFGAGIIYSVNTDGTDFRILVNFGAGNSDGESPASGLFLTPDGILFGTTSYGASGGTVFRFRLN